MNKAEVQKTGKKIFALIDTKFASDACFERAAGLMPKTVNNWRRGLSSSYMKMLPELSQILGTTAGALLDTDGMSNLSENEQEIITLYRSAGKLSDRELNALTETIKNTIGLYLSSHSGSGDKE